jgi:hypothetical protein
MLSAARTALLHAAEMMRNDNRLALTPQAA